MKNPWVQPLRRFALPAAVVSLIAIAAVEVTLRIAEPARLGDLRYREELGTFGYPPGFDGHPYGMNDAPLPFDRPSTATPRIVIVTDSYGRAGGRRNYTWLLEPLLAARLGRRVEVVNVAVDGWGMREVDAALTHHALKYHPDVIVYGFTLNDFWSALPGIEYRAINGIPLLVDHSTLWEWLRPDHWYLAEFVRTTWTVRQAAREQAAAAARGEQSGGPLSTERFEIAVADGLGTYFVPSATGRPGELLAKFLAATPPWIEHMRDASREAGATFAVLYHPFVPQYDADAARRAAQRRGGSMPRANFDFDLPNHEIRSIAAMAQVPFFDAAPAFRHCTGGAALHLPNDGHYSVAGNTCLAQAATPWLISLLPR